ncbi:Sip1-related alpha-galactosidase [Pontiella agarivorans]|uniref:Sip1-related alpha-galactosidase n=1 Tax=Pontiella agarivorans TaxID=3038953 RepID=A0ABU5MTM9_9BACT|nr:Sip1-related alpha-galactosidase [Pontiella agarivorans]MDZ8117478.1 Sip1-related alpha-galactosidase [Pontiella agarivorans]
MSGWLLGVGYLVGVFCLWVSPCGADVLDLSRSRNGVEVLRDYSGTPDSSGVLEVYALKIPAVKQAAYWRGEWWPYGGNRVCGEVLSRDSEEGGLFSILELNDGSFLAVLPLCGDQAWAWFAPDDGELKLKLGTKGTATVSGNLPVVAWSRSASPYEAASEVWKLAAETKPIRDHMKLRGQKPYPEMFNYLGWCSWEEFKKEIRSDLLVNVFQALEENELPIRYMLVDDGHFSAQTLLPKRDTFPEGYAPLTALRNDRGISWVGMWHALLGEAKGLEPGNPPALSDAMMTLRNGKAVPKPDARSIRMFMEYLFSSSEKDDIDFIKVDFCGTLLPFIAGTETQKAASDFPETNEQAIGNPSAMAALYSRIYQSVAEERFDGVLNCNWHVPHFIFNSGNSVVGRCGPDYKLTVERARRSVFTNFSTIPWLGQVAWGDHDMFHSSDKLAARMMAVSKALSGGPAYLSDAPDRLVPEVVWPLCYSDGRLLRPLAPGAPLPEDLFMNENTMRIFRTMSPLPNRSAAFACFNLQGDGKRAEPVLETIIKPEHYSSASGMIQPFPGDWNIPEEGLLVYDFQTRSAVKLPCSGYRVKLAGFGEYLLQLSPVQNGWSVIGRPDKYLAAAAVDVLHCDEKELSVRMHEAGPLAIWLEKGVPYVDGAVFKSCGNGLFVAEWPATAEPAVITIRKGEQ